MFHLFASEQGGPCMVETMHAMRRDAEQQEAVITILGKVLDVTVARAAQDPHRGAQVHSSLRVFQGGRRCPLKPSAFLARMLKYGHCSPCCLLVAMVYLQRINLRCSSTLVMTPHNIQRLLLTAVMLASKFLDDLFCSNQQVKHTPRVCPCARRWSQARLTCRRTLLQWASIGDLQLREMNELELHMLKLLDFSLSISREIYNGSWTAVMGMAQKVGPAESWQADVPKIKIQSGDSLQPSRPAGPISPVASSPAAYTEPEVEPEFTTGLGGKTRRVPAAPADPGSPSSSPALIPGVQSPTRARSSVAPPRVTGSPGALPTLIARSATARPARNDKHAKSPSFRSPSPIPASLQWERSAMLLSTSAMLLSDVKELHHRHEQGLRASPAPRLLTTRRPSVAGFSTCASPPARAVVY